MNAYFYENLSGTGGGLLISFVPHLLQDFVNKYGRYVAPVIYVCGKFELEICIHGDVLQGGNVRECSVLVKNRIYFYPVCIQHEAHTSGDHEEKLFS